MKIFILLLSVISSVAFANVSPCGLEGSVEDRIKSCNFIKENFALVARMDKGLEIYKDVKSGLIWSDRITADYNHYGSQKACGSDIPDAEVLKDMHWRLPTIHEFEVAATHGMKSALPKSGYSFWSSTPVKSSRRARRQRAFTASVFIWDGTDERTDTGDLKEAASVRCVAK